MKFYENEDIFNEEAAKAKLTEQEVEVLKHRYGIGKDAPMLLEDIASLLGTTRERVRLIEQRAIHQTPLVQQAINITAVVAGIIRGDTFMAYEKMLEVFR